MESKSIDRIFWDAAQMVSADERAAYLDRACAKDTALRQRVEELLQARSKALHFLEPIWGELGDTVADPTVHETPGSSIGPYKLLEELGEGGFGVVFMAEQQYPVRRQVALKVLKAGMDSRQVIARFEAERQALALMDHPNIARVFDGGETAGGRPYFVMELVKGVPITAFCDQYHLSVAERLDLFVEVCQAIQHAHHKGIIHRDIKPSNVLVTLDDGIAMAKVIDFGIAKAIGLRLTEKTLFTNLAQMIGTPLYMSPEQAHLSDLDVDTRSDVYSLGVLLYELLTGKTPFDKERFREAGYDEICRIIREEDPPRPSARMKTLVQAATVSAQRKSDPRHLRQVVRGELDWIVMKCLEKDRSRRYESAGALAADIRRYLNDEPVLACPPSAAYRFRKLARRHKAAITAAVVIAAVGVFGLVVSIALAVWALNAEGLAKTRLQAETQERLRAIEAQRAGKHQLYTARLAQARASRLSRQVGQRFESWKALGEAARLARELELGQEHLQQLRDEAIACLALADMQQIRKEWPGFPPESRGFPVFDAELEHYARMDDKGGFISVRRVADDGELARLTSGRRMPPGCFSPGGDLLAAFWRGEFQGQPPHLEVWDWRGDRRMPRWSVPGPAGAAAFSPDGRSLAVGQEDGTVTIFEVASGKKRTCYRVGFRVLCVAYHPDGSKLAVAGARVEVRDAASGERFRKLRAPAGVWSLAWHPDGGLLAGGCHNSDICLWGRASNPDSILRGQQGLVAGVAFAGGGDILVGRYGDGTSRLWGVWDGQEVLQLPGWVRQVSRDGCRLAVHSSSGLAVWEVVASPCFRTLPRCRTPDKEHHSLAYSPDGQWLLAGTNRGAWLWDLAGGKEATLLPLGRTVDVQFHPSGKELFTSGQAGLYRWAVQAQPGAVRIGPARQVLSGSALQRFSLDRNGHLLAVVRYPRESRIVRLDGPPGKAIALTHKWAVFTAISPDGKWVATGTWNGQGVKVWEAASGRLARHLIPDEKIASVAFGLDGGRLLTATSTAVALWKVDSWELAREVPREQGLEPQVAAALAPNGKMLAIPSGLSAVQLVDPETGLPVARLEGPEIDPVRGVAFHPESTRLAMSTNAGHVRTWDLRRACERLSELGLDWDLPGDRPQDEPSGARPVRVEVDLADFQRLLKAN
jgi:serine/threonine protein kinase/WD40 repeat protein